MLDANLEHTRRCAQGYNSPNWHPWISLVLLTFTTICTYLFRVWSATCLSLTFWYNSLLIPAVQMRHYYIFGITPRICQIKVHFVSMTRFLPFCSECRKCDAETCSAVGQIGSKLITGASAQAIAVVLQPCDCRHENKIMKPILSWPIPNLHVWDVSVPRVPHRA